MRTIHIFMAILWYLSCSELEAKSKLRYLYYRNITYTYNPNHFTAANIYTTEEDQAVEIEVAISHNITKDIWMEFVVSMKPFNADKFQNVFNFNLNGCTLLKRSSGPGGFDVVKKWTTNLLNSGTSPISCPVMKNNYTWTILPSRRYGVHILQMEGFYRLIFNVYLKRSKRTELLMNTSTISELIYKYK
ncbi:uncharacterized protein LOC126762838 [Bactrocera neohumeralis]|uniref:uncharacterized protein LOC126762838 n=1 Tax=Bactrocera neohumeralis TaxID=98809 RepID=UPI00216525C3|nr:uncharacterized protein LOC126762838 [Bactrocera neohumeralis]